MENGYKKAKDFDIGRFIEWVVWRANLHGLKPTPVQIMFFAYLLDLYFASANGGLTLTGWKWMNSHYMPYCTVSISAINEAEARGLIRRDRASAPQSSFNMVTEYGHSADLQPANWPECLPARVSAEIINAVDCWSVYPNGFASYVRATAPMHIECGQRLSFSAAEYERTPVLRDRYRGCLLGLAAGDALGTTLEFRARGTFTPITDIVGGGPFGLKPGYWTDDTSMALCLAKSLIECRRFDPRDQLKRYVQWWREGYMSSLGWCFDIGNTVRAALEQFERTGEEFCGSTDERSAGNGSLMRLASVVLFCRDVKTAVELAAASSRTTHAATEAVDACRYMAALLFGLIRNTTKPGFISLISADVFSRDPSCYLTRRVIDIALGSFRTRDRNQIRGTGYVVDSLEAALWSFHHASSFREAVLTAVNLGDDADTTGAICGQMAGAFYGAEAIPPEWLQILHERELIFDMADQLYEIAIGRR